MFRIVYLFFFLQNFQTSLTRINPTHLSEDAYVEDAVEIILPTSIDEQSQIHSSASETESPANAPVQTPIVTDTTIHQAAEIPNVHYHQPPNYQIPHPQNPHLYYQNNALPQERSFGTIGIGWIIGGGLITFAFVNTILLGATMFFTFGFFQWLLGIIQVIAPSVGLAVSQAFTAIAVPLAAAAAPAAALAG